MTGIRTDYDPKPIPDRRFDWSAVTDDYGGEESEPIGYGATEQAAILDLQEQLDEREAEKAESEGRNGHCRCGKFERDCDC